MNYKRIGRLLVCLVLVCCLIVRISPIQAKAAPFTPGMYALDAFNLMVGGARALGIGPGDDPLDFNNLITDAKNALFSGTSPLADVWLDYVNGGFRAFLSAEFLADLLSFFFHSGALVRNTATSAPSSSKYYYLSDAVALARTYPYAYFLTPESSTADYYVWVSLDPFTMVHEGGNAVALSRTGPVWEWHERTSNDSFRNSTSYTQSTFYLSCASVEFIGASSVSSDLDLSLDSVSDSLSGSAYSDWSASSQTIDEQQFFPVSIPSLSDSTAISTQTQTQAQAGTATDAVVDEIISSSDAGVVEGLNGVLAETKADTFLGAIGDFFVSIGAIITDGFNKVMTITDTISSSITSFGESIVEKLTAVWTVIRDGFTDVISGVKTLPEAIAQAIAAIFVPSVDYITAKVEAIRAMFPFMDSIIATGEYIRDSLSGSSGPPAIYVDLTLADGDIDYGEKTLLTDFSWYAPYKGRVDSVLGAALWAFFSWRVFLRLPGLISGADGYVGEFRSLSSRSSGSSGKKKED